MKVDVKSKSGKKKGKRASAADPNQLYAPPIYFKPTLTKQTAEGDGKPDKKGKEERKEIELLLDPSDKDSGTIKKHVLVLRHPDPESWIIWLREFEEICEGAPIKGAKLQAISAQQFLAGTAREVWQKCFTEAVAAEAETLTDPELTAVLKERAYKGILSNTITACTREIFRMENPARRQK